jgi:hypothetical protein
MDASLMANQKRTRAVVAIIGIVVLVALGGGGVRRLLHTEVRTVSGTVTRIDPAARVASIQIVHPKTGQTITIDGRVPPDCDIQIDQQPAALHDLRVGDAVTVEGTVHWDRTVSANWVRVSRAAPGSAGAPATSHPATTRSTGTP